MAKLEADSRSVLARLVGGLGVEAAKRNDTAPRGRVMLKRLVCWLVGHKFILETDVNPVGFGVTHVSYRILKFCMRCGCENNQYPKEVQR